MISVKNLEKHFGQVRAVDGLSFETRAGEIFGLLGPNGAGKTTTLRLLSTLLRPTRGTASVAGYDILKDPQEVRRHIGVVCEGTGLYDRLTPRETLLHYAMLYDIESSIVRRKIEELSELLDMGEYMDRRAGKLSRGMKQRVAVARALVCDPSVLLFDEPTAGLDVVSARAVQDFIESFRSAQKTILLSTHIMSLAERLCDRIAIISRGKIKAIGTFEELREKTGEEDLEEIFLKLVRQE